MDGVVTRSCLAGQGVKPRVYDRPPCPELRRCRDVIDQLRDQRRGAKGRARLAARARRRGRAAPVLGADCSGRAVAWRALARPRSP
jgi:hypothetical protein